MLVFISRVMVRGLQIASLLGKYFMHDLEKVCCDEQYFRYVLKKSVVVL
jgi:hypothetical protein